VASQLNPRREILHAIPKLLERIHLHVFALAAPAGVGGRTNGVECRCADEFLMRAFLLETVNNPGLCDDDELFGGIGFAVRNHLLG